jgi:polynucleotide 5'-kinase involved in rRNA processing
LFLKELVVDKTESYFIGSKIYEYDCDDIMTPSITQIFRTQELGQQESNEIPQFIQRGRLDSILFMPHP